MLKRCNFGVDFAINGYVGRLLWQSVIPTFVSAITEPFPCPLPTSQLFVSNSCSLQDPTQESNYLVNLGRVQMAFGLAVASSIAYKLFSQYRVYKQHENREKLDVEVQIEEALGNIITYLAEGIQSEILEDVVISHVKEIVKSKKDFGMESAEKFIQEQLAFLKGSIEESQFNGLCKELMKAGRKLFGFNQKGQLSVKMRRIKELQGKLGKLGGLGGMASQAIGSATSLAKTGTTC